MALLPRSGELAGVTNLQELIALVGVPGAVWTAFIGQVGDPGTNLQPLASLPDFIVAQACPAATFPDGSAFNPINATRWGCYDE